jgi:23S rRNA (guanosine2251-2'-O)-methyltransferase
LVRTIKELQKLSLWVIGLDGETQSLLYQLNLTEPIVLVMGTEGKGLRKLVKKTCDQLVKIPMHGNVESLNVSVATGIALFEATRQRQSY